MRGAEGRESEPEVAVLTDIDGNKGHQKVGLQTIRAKVMVNLLKVKLATTQESF